MRVGVFRQRDEKSIFVGGRENSKYKNIDSLSSPYIDVIRGIWYYDAKIAILWQSYWD